MNNSQNPIPDAIATIDRYELALRIAESVIGVERPVDTLASIALMAMPPENRRSFLTAADVAAKYITECINSAAKVN